MKQAINAMLVMLVVSCGNERVVDHTRNDPDLNEFQLQNDQTGIYGYWRRVERTDNAEVDIKTYVTIDSGLLFHTTSCKKNGETTRATAYAKILITEQSEMTITRNDYVEVAAQETNLVCHSSVRKGVYALKQPTEDELQIRQSGQKPMTFVRVDKSAVTGY